MTPSLPCPHGRASWASCPHCLGVNRQPAPKRLLCLHCGAETDAAENERLNACPACGDSEHPPADLSDTVTITLTKHELRILTFWASNWAAQGESTQEAMRTILNRLATQTDTALTLGQEIADLRAAFPESEVTVRNADGTESGL